MSFVPSIRDLRPNDINRIREIHAKHFKTEFDFPDFLKGFLCAFVVHDESNNIICAGGVRNLAEVVLVTDKDFSVRARRKSLYNVLDASAFIAGKKGHDALHAFITDETWMEHLTKVGFHSVKGNALIMEL